MMLFVEVSNKEHHSSLSPTSKSDNTWQLTRERSECFEIEVLLCEISLFSLYKSNLAWVKFTIYYRIIIFVVNKNGICTTKLSITYHLLQNPCHRGSWNTRRIFNNVQRQDYQTQYRYMFTINIHVYILDKKLNCMGSDAGKWMEENCWVNGGGRGFLFSSSPLWSVSISFSLKSVEEKQALALSLSSQSRRGRTDERKVSTAEYLKLWKVVNLVASFFFLSLSSFRRGFVRFSKPDKKLLLRRPSCRRLRARNSELKRSFVKKVSTIYSPVFFFFFSFQASNWDSLRLVFSGEMDNQRSVRSQLNCAFPLRSIMIGNSNYI